VLDPSGRALRSFEVKASYALVAWLAARRSQRLGWLYDKFADLAADELQKFVMPPRAPVQADRSRSSAGLDGSARASRRRAVPAFDPRPGAVRVDRGDRQRRAVPVSERGREAYRDWLTHRKPRAFVLSENGWFYVHWSTKPPRSEEPSDPLERVMKRCRDAGRPNLPAVRDRRQRRLHQAGSPPAPPPRTDRGARRAGPGEPEALR
jgi:hypothetical protein